jgi:hypothetical protein
MYAPKILRLPSEINMLYSMCYVTLLTFITIKDIIQCPTMKNSFLKPCVSAKKRLKTSKGQSESINPRRADNTMAKKRVKYM